MLIARQYLIRGRVQGVGFRFFAADAAAAEGLSGSVRNVRDARSVEVIVEGDADAVARLERALYRGPPGACVEAVEVCDRLPTGKSVGFSIRD